MSLKQRHRVADSVVAFSACNRLPCPSSRTPSSSYVSLSIDRRLVVLTEPLLLLQIYGRLFWQGEPDLQDPAIGFAAAVTEAVEIVSGVREIPAWFREKMDEGGG